MTLPHRLRRYLRAFLGHASLADEAMLDALEGMVMQHQAVTPMAAFRAAHRTATRMTPVVSGSEPMRRAIAALPSGSRAAFLLLRLEHFTPEEAAGIMDLSVDRVIEEARAAALDIQRLLVPPGGTALITDHDQLTAMDLGNVAADIGFNALREPAPTMSTLVGRPSPILIIAEAVGRDGMATTPMIAALARRFDAAILCVTASRHAEAFLRDLPEAQLLRKPFETATAARSMLDVVAYHRCSRLDIVVEGEG